MSLFDIASLMFLMAALAAVPSTSVAWVVSRSAVYGVAQGAWAAAGIVLGDLCFVVLAAFGLAVLASTFGSLFFVVKLIGGMYLVCFGWALFRAGGAGSTIPIRQRQRGSVMSFLGGLLITLGDVKAIKQNTVFH